MAVLMWPRRVPASCIELLLAALKREGHHERAGYRGEADPVCYQLGTIRDQFLGPHSKDIELGTADHETDVLEQAAVLVLDVTLDLDQQRPARQQRPNRVAIGALDAHLLQPAGLHDTGDPASIIAVALIDLHLEYRLGVARVDADHGQAKLLELGPQPCGCRSCLKADPYRSWRLRSYERSDRLRLGIDYALSHD